MQQMSTMPLEPVSPGELANFEASFRNRNSIFYIFETAVKAMITPRFCVYWLFLHFIMRVARVGGVMLVENATSDALSEDVNSGKFTIYCGAGTQAGLWCVPTQHLQIRFIYPITIRSMIGASIVSYLG